MSVNKTGHASKSTHYQAGSVQPIDLIMSQKLSFCEGSLLKYLCRYKRKGTPLEDLDKMQQYLDWVREEYLAGQNPEVPQIEDHT